MTKLEYARRNQARIMRHPIDKDLKPFKMLNLFIIVVVLAFLFLISF